MLNKKVAILGCGNLGLSIANGLISSGLSAKNIIATRRNPDRLAKLQESGILVSTENSLAIEQSEIIIVALKPYNIIEVLKGLSKYFDPKKHILISLATGITLDQLEAIVPAETPVYRAMPNTASDVSMSMTCIASKQAKSENTKLVSSCFDAIGKSIVIDESLMNSATVLGACGIAYVLRFIRAMIQGGIEIGFDAKTASEIVTNTVKGAAELLLERGQHPEFEIDKVTTPKGCTITGLNQMEHNGFSSALIKGIVSSYEKIES